VRCSSCEARLDEYVDGTLTAPAMRAVAVHLQNCAGCEGLHQRLRIVDGLLETVRGLDLTPDFTFDVMEAVRMLPSPEVPRRPVLRIAGLYLASAWIAFAIAFAFFRSALTGSLHGLQHAAGGVLGLVGGGVHLLWPVTPVALPLVVSVLCADAILFAVLVGFYRTVRPRLHAHLSTVPVERD
jgi:predicted anti-sigma-YlaC factor YlaD